MRQEPPSLAAERAWFNTWTATVQSELVMYEQVFESLYLRPADIQRAVDVAVRTDILRDAMRNHQEEWQQALDLLSSSAPLTEIVRSLFGEAVPVSVAVLVLGSIHWEEEATSSPDAPMGEELNKREHERHSIGLPTFLWTVEIEERGRMSVSVEERDAVASGFRGLVRIADPR